MSRRESQTAGSQSPQRKEEKNSIWVVKALTRGLVVVRDARHRDLRYLQPVYVRNLPGSTDVAVPVDRAHL